MLEARAGGANAVYKFVRFRVEVSQQRLLKDGLPVSLAPKEFDTLKLVERHGRLVTNRNCRTASGPERS